jgi:Domain of unknown function (DUF4276)
VRMCLAPIVEGHGEVEAVPALLHRIAVQVGFEGTLRMNPPIRVKSGSFLNDEGYFRRYVDLAARKAAQEDGVVLIVLDCEDDCPAALGPRLSRRAVDVRNDVETFVILAYREYETWFLAAASSLRGLYGLPADLEAPPHPEGIRNAKGWLGDRMDGGYDPVVHQLAFTRAFDLRSARSARSFDRLYDRVKRLLES